MLSGDEACRDNIIREIKRTGMCTAMIQLFASCMQIVYQRIQDSVDCIVIY